MERGARAAQTLLGRTRAREENEMRDHDAFLLPEVRARQGALLREADTAHRLHEARAPSWAARLLARLARPAPRPAPPTCGEGLSASD